MLVPNRVLNRAAEADTGAVSALVGRVRELAEVEAAIAGAAAGRGRLLLISGPAGIGKSRLVDAALERAVQLGLPAGVGHAVDDPGAPPLWPWRRALAGLALDDALAAVPADRFEPDAGVRFRLFATVAERLAGLEPPGAVLVLEDLHWADEPSVGLLRHLARELASLPVAVLATYRDVGDGPLQRALGQLVRGDAVRPLGLDALSAEEIAAWLPALGVEPAIAAALHERTGGNALLVRLVAEDLATRPVPLPELMRERPHLRHLVAARLVPLAPAARELVDVAAVVGERVPWALLTALVGEPEARTRALVDEAGTAGILELEQGEVRFVHALVRDAAYAELAEPRRAALHRAAAVAMAGLDRPDLAGSIAFHWRRAAGADAVQQCLEWAERADELARTVPGGTDAASYARLAVAAAREAAVAERELARLLVRLAEACVLTHDLAAAVAAAEEAAELAERLGAPELLGRAALVVQGTGDPTLLTGVRRLCERALAGVAPDAVALRARLSAQLAVCHAEHDEFEPAAELAAAALAAARESGDPEARLEALAARHLTISVPQRVEERLALGREAVALGTAARRPIAALWGHLWRLDASLQLGNLAEADRELAEIDRVARAHRSPLARWHHHRYQAVVHQQAGRFAEAEEHNRASYELGERMDDFSMVAMYYAFQIHLAVLRRSDDRVDTDWAAFVERGRSIPLVGVSRVLMLACFGDRDAAKAEFATFRELPDRYPVGPRWYATVAQVGMAATVLGDAEVAGRAYEALRSIAHYHSGDGSGGVFSHGANAGIVADLARAAGRHEEAVGLYPDAVAMNDRVGARPFSALSRLGWARSLLALDTELDRAAELAAAAVAQLRQLDLPGRLAEAEATAAEIAGARRGRSPLSGREVEIAELVAAALSNRQIAQRLVLSERTVESHVRNILTKLGFSTRTEIATWVVQRRSAARAD